MELFSQSIENLEHALDMRSTNQRVIAANLANINTPGYQAQRMDFAASMARALDDVDHPEIIGPTGDPAGSLDGNNVDLEGELAAMNRNKTMYSLTAQILAARLRQITTIFDQEQ